jgi:hypothetical protein
MIDIFWTLYLGINIIQNYNCYNMPDTTTIRIKVETRNTLKELGNLGDDYNSVIDRLIREHNRERLVQYSRKVVEERKGDFVDLDDL